jgi:hypothetical protein
MVGHQNIAILVGGNLAQEIDGNKLTLKKAKDKSSIYTIKRKINMKNNF